MRRARLKTLHTKDYKKAPIVKVKFWDHVSGVPDDDLKPLTCEVIGALVHEDQHYYRLVTWLCEGDISNHNGEGFALLKSTVISVEKVS